MDLYLYDGSFESLIGLCSALIGRKENPDGIAVQGTEQPGLFDAVLSLSCDIQSARSEISYLEKGPSSAMRYICGAFMSELPGMEMSIFRFISAVKQNGFSSIENLADDRILDIYRIQQKVFIEKHRMMGLLRFSELSDGTLYAPFEPDHNITGIIAPHFSRRLSQNDWIIHDRKRDLGAIYKKKSGKWMLFDMEQNSPFSYSNNEFEYRNLWKLYYREISIPERKNPRCQKRFMPVRYWKYLTERQKSENANKLVLLPNSGS